MGLSWGQLLFVWINAAGLVVGIVWVILKLTNSHLETAAKASKSESELREVQAKASDKLLEHYATIQTSMEANHKDTGELLTQNYGFAFKDLISLVAAQGKQGLRSANESAQVQGQLAAKIAMLILAAGQEPDKGESVAGILREISESNVNLGARDNHEPEPDPEEMVVAPQHII